MFIAFSPMVIIDRWAVMPVWKPHIQLLNQTPCTQRLNRDWAPLMRWGLSEQQRLPKNSICFQAKNDFRTSHLGLQFENNPEDSGSALHDSYLYCCFHPCDLHAISDLQNSTFSPHSKTELVDLTPWIAAPSDAHPVSTPPRGCQAVAMLRLGFSQWWFVKNEHAKTQTGK